MPSFIVHGLIPLLLLLALRLTSVRVALLMLPFTWLADLDYWFGFHRATTSNIFWLLPFLLAWYLWREHRPTWAPYAAVASYYLASHMILDIFAGGVVLFWPLWDQTFFWQILVLVNTQTGETDVVNDPGSFEGVPEVAEVFAWISPFEAAMLALTVIVVGATLLYRHWPTRTVPVLEEIE